MLRYGIRQMDGLLLTHEHRDHTAGLDDVRGFNFITQAPVDVFATDATQRAIHRDFQYIFSGVDYPGLPKVRLITISDKAFEIRGLPVMPIQVMHYQMPVLGFRIADFAYITDANFIDDQEREKTKGCKVIVLNALRREQHISHFTLDQAMELAQQLGAETTYFTHISHQLGSHASVMRELPPRMELAFDGLEIVLD
jgi:phosphoribosyl 1,2-cyclic phosphate phosphodiesterase